MLSCKPTYRAFANTLMESRPNYVPKGDCKHRAPERLPGYIDIHVWSSDNLQTVIAKPHKISVAVCLCKKPDNLAEALYASHMQALKDKRTKDITDGMETLEELTAEYND